MTFSEFAKMYFNLYRAAHNRDPFSITTRRAFNRHRHLPAPSIVIAVTNELSAD